ncbi:hypothetical protein Tco_1342425, partial [Tanacetum coccineum]
NGYKWQSQAPRNHGGALAQTRSERVLKKTNKPPLPEGHTSGSGEGSMEHTFELMDIVPPTPYISPLTGGYTPGSDKGRLKLKELMAMCTKLSKQVLDLEKEKDAQAVEILKLKQRVKKLERKRKLSISHPRKRIYRQVESSDDDLDEEDASKHGRESDKTKSMFQDSDFDVLDEDMEDVEGEIVHTATTGVSTVSAPVTTAGVAISNAEPRTPPTTAATAFIDEDLTISHTLIKMKEEKAKETGVSIKDVEDSPRPIRSITTLQPLLTIDPKDKELAQRLHERKKQEEATNATLAEEFDEIQARIDADHEVDKKETISSRKSRGNKEQTTYKNSSQKQDDYLPQTYGTKKRPRADSKEESSKKQQLEENNDAEKEELRDSMDVVPRDDVAIDVESLATKYPIID